MQPFAVAISNSALEKSTELENFLRYLGVKFTFTPSEVTSTNKDKPPELKASEFSSPVCKETETRKRPAPVPAPVPVRHAAQATSGTRPGEPAGKTGEDRGKPGSAAGTVEQSVGLEGRDMQPDPCKISSSWKNR